MQKQQLTSRLLIVGAILVVVVLVSITFAYMGYLPMDKACPCNSHSVLQPPVPLPPVASGNECRTLQQYVPSYYEKLWYDNIHQWKTAVCEHQRDPNQAPAILEWLNNAGVHKVPHDPLPSVFSYFTYSNSCNNQLNSEVIYIEPVAGISRTPLFCTQSPDTVVDKGYLTVDCQSYPPNTRAFYFDLGASSWNAGAGGASQSWFYNTYRECGVNFVGLYMWEVQAIDPVAFWKEIPAEVKPYYHWYNIPADPTPDAPDNPWRYLRAAAKPEDFVLLKVDIDNSPVELKLVNQLLEDPSLLALIDDFYFEHHVDITEMRPYWGPDCGSDLEATYVLFQKFRNAGIRAHVWV